MKTLKWNWRFEQCCLAQPFLLDDDDIMFMQV